MADQPALELDNKAEVGFINAFRALPEKTSNCIRLFERNGGEFYSVHGDDALVVAQRHYRTTAVIKYIGGNDGTSALRLPSCTLSSLNMESFAREALLTHVMKVEIWAQVDSKKANTWQLVRQASPGNLQDFEDIVDASPSSTFTNPVIMAIDMTIVQDQRIIGICFIDTSRRILGMSKFSDSELYANLESLSIQLGVKECLVKTGEASQAYELNKLRSVLINCGIALTDCSKKDFAHENIEQDLMRLINDNASLTAILRNNNKNVMAAAACVIKYLRLLADDSNFGRYQLVSHSLESHMRLDIAAIRALNLFPSPTDGYHKNTSLFGLLNYCKTSPGSRLLNQWIKQPLMNKCDIEERLDVVELFLEDTELRQTVRDDHLKMFPDMSCLARRFQRGKSTIQDLVRAYQTIIQLPNLLNVLRGYTGSKERFTLLERLFITPLEDIYKNASKLQTLVEETVDLEAVDNHEYMIKTDVDVALKELREQMEFLKSEIDPEVNKVARDLDQELHKVLKVEKNNVNGYHMRLSRTNASVLRDKTGYIELSTQKAGILFTTTKLKRLSNELIDASSRYDKAQSSFVKELMGIVATYCPILEELSVAVARLDVLLSFAHVSLHASMQYVRPKLNEKGQGNLNLRASRHPCVEVQEDVSFIPNDVAVIRDESMFQIMTGPNMGGKSTYIRQIGVIVLMAQIGCFVPCAEAEITIVDAVLARVGAGDSQLKGISTFMAEMLETAYILKVATKYSLLVIDELGRGTSTYDGFGLAWAISEHISSNIGCICFFATHFHELTTLEGKSLAVKNIHVASHVSEERDITLLYRVKEGVCDQSFGIHVAEIVNFPRSVVQLAKRKADELEDFATGVPHSELSSMSEIELQTGDELIERFMMEFASIESMLELPDEEVVTRVQRLKVKYKQELEANRFVKCVLAQSA